MANIELNTRGFDALAGETISHVITSAINVVHIHCKSGKVVSVDAEESHFGIPVIRVADWTGHDSE